MKKFILVAIALLGAATLSYAQPRAIGARIGSGFEASYQHGIGEKNMISLDLGLPLAWGSGLEAAGTFDWLIPIKSWEHKGEWNLYPGVGIGGGFYNFWGPIGFVGVAARFGAEYNFWFPLQLSLDYRPIIGVAFPGGPVFNTPGLWNGGIAAGVRYKF